LLERCTFRDAVPHDEVLRRMAVARVVIVPSRSEAFGLVNIEAMSVGTPVIASAVDGIKEIVRDGLDGVLVAPDDSNALAKQITSLLNDPSRRAEMSQYARERFLRVYEQSEVVTAQADWLEGITQVAVGRDTLTQPHDAALALDRK
jgi:glycosyltransferase involved in cell wall biosynthesis